MECSLASTTFFPQERVVLNQKEGYESCDGIRGGFDSLIVNVFTFYRYKLP